MDRGETPHFPAPISAFPDPLWIGARPRRGRNPATRPRHHASPPPPRSANPIVGAHRCRLIPPPRCRTSHPRLSLVCIGWQPRPDPADADAARHPVAPRRRHEARCRRRIDLVVASSTASSSTAARTLHPAVSRRLFPSLPASAAHSPFPASACARGAPTRFPRARSPRSGLAPRARVAASRRGHPCPSPRAPGRAPERGTPVAPEPERTHTRTDRPPPGH